MNTSLPHGTTIVCALFAAGGAGPAQPPQAQQGDCAALTP
jgi:hypothetical protein